MAQCIICGSYTKFTNGKCYECYTDPGDGLDDREWEYRYNLIKGRIAETLIQELFLSLKYNVFRYGMEHTVPGITQLLKEVKSEVAVQIRRMPDFVVQNNGTHEVFFVEVKFRANGTFRLADLPKDYPYENAYIIVVSKRHIKCLSVGELKKGLEITPDCRNYLGNRKEFALEKEVIKDFCDFAIKFFKEV